MTSVASVLEQHIDPATKRLELPKGALGDYVKAMLVAYVTDEKWSVDGANVTGNADGSATLVGTGSSLPFKGMTIDAAFAPPADSSTATIVATAPAGWTLGTAFPSLSGTFVPLLTYGPSQSLTLKCESAPSASGLTYQGAVELDGGLVPLAEFLYGGRAETALTGPIAMQAGAPQLAVTAPTTKPIEVGADHKVQLGGVTFGLETKVSPGETGKPAKVEADLALASELSFVARGTTIPLPLRVSYSPAGGFVQFVAQAQQLASAGLAEVSTLLDGRDLKGLVPDGLHLEDVLTLTDVTVQVDPSGPTLQWVMAGVKTVKPWTLVQGSGSEPTIAVNEIALVFRLFLAGDGGLQAAAFGEIAIGTNGKLDVSALYPGFALSGELRPGTTVNLKEVVEHFTGPNPDVPAIVVTEFGFFVAPPAYRGALTVRDDWPIPLGGDKTLKISEVGFAIEHEGPGKTQARVHGAAEVLGGSIAVDWDVPGDFQLSGVLPHADLSALIQDFSGHRLPNLPAIQLERTSLHVEKRANGGFYAAFGTSVAHFGVLEIDFYEIEKKTGFAAGFVLPETWSLRDLSHVFDPVGFLKFKDASLIVASADDPNFRFRSFTEPGFKFPTQPPSAPKGVRAGVALYAKLLVEGGPLGVISQLFPKVSTLEVALVFPADYTQTQISADYAGRFAIFPDTVFVDRFKLIAAPGQGTFAAALDVTFTIHDHSVKLTGEVELRPDQVDLIVKTTGDWVHPFGIEGLTIRGLYFELALEAGEVAVTLAGAVTIGTGDRALPLEAAVEFNAANGGAPDAFMAEEHGTIRLQDAVEGLIGVALPADLLDIELSNFHLLAVANPNGWVNPIDDKFYRQGLAFSGKLAFYGLVAQFAIQVDYSAGIDAKGQIEGPLEIGHVIKLTAADKVEKGPAFSLSTAGPVYLCMTAQLTLFELATTLIEAKIARDSFHVHLKEKIEYLGEVDIDVYLRRMEELGLHATCKLKLPTLGPIKTPLGFTIGALDVDLSLDAAFGVDVSPTSIRLELAAGFEFRGRQRHFGPVHVEVSIARLSELAKVYAKHLADELWEIARDVFQEAGMLFAAAKDGVVTLSDDIVHVLRRELGVGIQDAAELLTYVADVMGWDTEDIARMLEDAFEAEAQEIGAALRAAGHDVESAARALAKVFENDAYLVAAHLWEAGYWLEDVAKALYDVFDEAASDVAEFFEDAFEAVGEAVEEALEYAGYVIEEVTEAMEDAYDWVEDVVEDIGEALDPTNW